MKTPITFTITSCNRIDLLEKTLNSFTSINNYEIDEFIMSDDSGNEEISNHLKSKYGDKFKIISNNPRVGLSRSIDNLFSNAKNEFIFHCEDDWMFDSNPNLISESLSILTENPDIHQVSVRHDHCNPHKPVGEKQYTSTSVEYWILSQEFRSMPTQMWNGYSWNPGLRRKSDYLKMFPNGVSEFGDEYDCADYTRNFNYKSAILVNTSCYHLGVERTKNFMI
jgi:GT2 family glycosyltransferase